MHHWILMHVFKCRQWLWNSDDWIQYWIYIQCIFPMKFSIPVSVIWIGLILICRYLKGSVYLTCGDRLENPSIKKPSRFFHFKLLKFFSRINRKFSLNFTLKKGDILLGYAIKQQKTIVYPYVFLTPITCGSDKMPASNMHR